MEIIISFPFKQILRLKGDPVPFTQINEFMHHFTAIIGPGFTSSCKKSY